MTLDDARECLGVARSASTDEIRGAFRRVARTVHPDRHTDAGPEERARLAREFDRARTARDVLLRFARYDTPQPAPADRRSARASGTTSTPRPQSRPAASASRPTTSTDAPPRARARPRTSESRRPETSAPRVTLRFDEFVAWSDAAGFGQGQRSKRWVDRTRIVVWSSLGALMVLLTAVGAALAFGSVPV